MAALCVLLLALGLVAPMAADDSAAGCERATAYVASAKLARFGQTTFVTYLDVGFQVRVMALDHATGKWSGPAVVGQATDNHGGAALAITRDGVLHLAYGAHGTPMQYVHSLAPGDIGHWSKPEPIGVRTTYPSLIAAPDGTLSLAYRGHDDPQKKDWFEWLLTFHTRSPAGEWSRGTVLADLPSDTSEARANYHHRLLRDDRGRLHLAWANILVAPGKVYYLCSADGGRTWSPEPGCPTVPLPVTAAGPTPVYVSTEANLMLAMAVDAAGVPHLLYGPEYGSSGVCHAVPDGEGNWRKLEEFELPGKTVWLHQAVFDGRGRLHVTFFAEEKGNWISNTACVHEAVWEPGKPWRQRVVADFTKFRRGCYMPAIAEGGGKLECLFYSGRDLDRATDTAGVAGHVGTDVYYADLTDDWLQQIAPKIGPRQKIAAAWEPLPQKAPPAPAASPAATVSPAASPPSAGSPPLVLPAPGGG
jgi:hypothetical protein